MVSKMSKHHKAADLHEVQPKWCDIQEGKSRSEIDLLKLGVLKTR
jgi:hypothetical protein